MKGRHNGGEGEERRVTRDVCAGKEVKVNGKERGKKGIMKVDAKEKK